MLSCHGKATEVIQISQTNLQLVEDDKNTQHKYGDTSDAYTT